jgi:hypothetical protein
VTIPPDMVYRNGGVLASYLRVRGPHASCACRALWATAYKMVVFLHSRARSLYINCIYAWMDVRVYEYVYVCASLRVQGVCVCVCVCV